MTTLPRAHDAQAGYTLVELLIVMALTAVLSLLMLSGLHFGTRAWEAGSRASLHVREIALAQARLRRSIGEAYPYLSTSDARNPHVVFEGDARSVSLLAAEKSLGAPGRSFIRLFTRGGEAGLDLVIGITPELSLEGAGARSEVLVRGIADVSFAYLGEDGVSWLSVWQGRTVLPRLVRVTVTFPEGDTHVWPPITIAPRVGADVACVFDPLVKSCVGR